MLVDCIAHMQHVPMICFRKGGSVAKSVAKKVVKRREWTKEDVRLLKGMAKQRMPAAKVAKSLKRTEGATRQKAFQLGVSMDTRR